MSYALGRIEHAFHEDGQRGQVRNGHSEAVSRRHDDVEALKCGEMDVLMRLLYPLDRRRHLILDETDRLVAGGFHRHGIGRAGRGGETDANASGVNDHVHAHVDEASCGSPRQPERRGDVVGRACTDEHIRWRQ